jgi:hypothetical protein
MAGKKGNGRPRSVVLPMDEVRQFASQGWCLRELADKFGCSRQCMLDRMREAGIPRIPPRSQPGRLNRAWKGGKYLDGDGYILVWMPDHPYATSAGRVREHRLVMELKLGRYLLPGEVVHHKDNDKENNHPDNLEVFSSNADHLRHTLVGQIPKWTEDGKRRIQEGVRRALENRRISIRKQKETDAPTSQ